MGQRGLNLFLLRIDLQIGNHILFRSIRRGLVYLIPLLLLGSFALLFVSLPIEAYQNCMYRLFGSNWTSLFLFVRDGSINILSLLMVISISYAYANEYNENNDHVSPIMTSAVALGSFTALTGISKTSFAIGSFGPMGLFLAITVAVSASALFTRLYSLRFFRIAGYHNGADTAFNNAASAIVPMTITVALFALIDLLLSTVFHIVNVQVFLSDQMIALFSHISSPFLRAMVFVLLVHVCWLFGMHGNNVLEPVAQKFFALGATANRMDLLQGLPPSHIVTKSFFDCFVLIGGCGAALCLLCAILFAGKHKHQLRLAKLSAVPVLCNVNELLVLGLPVVLNPIFVIPFLGVPMLLTLLSYGAMATGLVPLPSQPVEWTTPILLSGYICTGSLSASALQLVNLVIGTLCYLPFVRLSERLTDAQVQNHLDKVYRAFRRQEERGMASSLLPRQDDVGMICRRLLADLEDDLNTKQLQMHYQPQISYDGRVTGMEALLRWNHRHYGWVHPPLMIALAEESGMIGPLGEWIFDKVCADLAWLHAQGAAAPTTAVNISAMQLEDEGFQSKLAAALARHGIAPCQLEIEITERVALAGSARVYQQLQNTQALGVRLAMDDFGMGHSSLLYLKEYHFDTVKLDGSLVREIRDNETCRNIVCSIAQLGALLQYTLVAEYVETDEQRGILHNLGCDTYQGYLYSPAMSLQQTAQFLLQHSALGSAQHCGDTRMDCG